ncbi:MAG: HAD-IA family hydrolase, partial [Clostridia bacterium]|nr:HAD-IA family hydrolase [Clostridia bacterium]
MMIKAVLFDLDGTLVNSLYDLADASNYALTVKGYPTHETEKYKYFVGNGMPNLMERILPSEERSAEKINELLDIFLGYYKEHYLDKTVVYEGIIPLLKALKAQGITVGVVSNKADGMTQLIIEKLLDGYFDIVQGKLEGFLPKPDPALTLLVMSKLGVKPDECIFVGDSGMDAALGVNCGAVPVGALWGFRTKEE